MSRRCRDCREEFSTERKTGRVDVCDHCWDNRGWLVENGQAVGITDMQTAQKKMAGRGNARPFIDALRASMEANTNA